MNQYQSESIDQLITALAKAQGEMSSAAKDCKGYNYKYADLASVWGACRGPLSNNGLAITQIETHNEIGEVLVTVLAHSSGQWMRSIMPIRFKPSGKGNELQELGSVYTYLRRYALSAIVGVAPEDDDGSSAPNFKASQQPPKQEAPKPLPGNYTPYISELQQEELAMLLGMCNKDYNAKVWEWLRSKKVDSLDKMPVTLYATVRERLEINMAKQGAHDSIMEE